MSDQPGCPCSICEEGTMSDNQPKSDIVADTVAHNVRSAEKLGLTGDGE